MANYNSYTRSNYFKVKNLELFKEQIAKMEGLDLFEYDDKHICVAIYGDLYSIDEEDREYTHDDYTKLIQEHIEEDETVFISSVGHEKLRYLGADCTIITKSDITYRNFFNEIAKEFNNCEDIF